MKRVIKITVPIDFHIEYENDGVSFKDLFSAILDSSSAAGWEIQDGLNALLRDKIEAISHAHVNIDLDKSNAHDYPKLNTDENYFDFGEVIEPVQTIIVE